MGVGIRFRTDSWLLNEIVTQWNSERGSPSLEELVAAAHHYSGKVSMFVVNDSVLMRPGDITSRIRSCRESRGDFQLIRALVPSTADLVTDEPMGSGGSHHG